MLIKQIIMVIYFVQNYHLNLLHANSIQADLVLFMILATPYAKCIGEVFMNTVKPV